MIFVLMIAVGQVCNRIVQYWCTFDWKLNRYACAIVLHALVFGVCTFTCVVTFFFEFAISKLVLHFFDCFTFALWTVFWYMLYTIICLWVCMILGVLVLQIQSPACLIFFSCFSHDFLSFVAKIFTFTLFVFCRFFSAILVSFFWLSDWTIRLLLCR